MGRRAAVALLVFGLATQGCRGWSHLLVTSDYARLPEDVSPANASRIDLDVCLPAAEARVLLDLWIPRDAPAPTDAPRGSYSTWPSLVFSCTPRSSRWVQVELTQQAGPEGRWVDPPSVFRCDAVEPPLEVQVRYVPCAGPAR